MFIHSNDTKNQNGVGNEYWFGSSEQEANCKDRFYKPKWILLYEKSEILKNLECSLTVIHVKKEWTQSKNKLSEVNRFYGCFVVLNDSG